MTVSHDPYIAEPVSDDASAGNGREAAKEQAHQVAGTTIEQASEVVGAAKEQAQAVTSEVRQQTQKLAGDAQTQLMEHATAQRDSAVQNLRSIGQELSSMADGAEGSGLGVQVVRQGGDLTTKAAEFLEQREPGQLLDELRDLARRRPGAFLLGAAFAGLVVGRAARGVKSAHATDDADPATTTAAPSAAGETAAFSDGLVFTQAPTPADTPAQVESPLSTEPATGLADEWGPSSPDYPGTPGLGADVSPQRGDMR